MDDGINLDATPNRIGLMDTFAKPPSLMKFLVLPQAGFAPEKLKCTGGTGCNEFVFVRSERREWNFPQ